MGIGFVFRRGNPTLHAEIVGVEHVTKWAKWNNKDVYEVSHITLLQLS